MSISGVGAVNHARMFRQTSKVQQAGISKADQANLKIVASEQKSTIRIRKNYVK